MEKKSRSATRRKTLWRSCLVCPISKFITAFNGNTGIFVTWRIEARPQESDALSGGFGRFFVLPNGDFVNSWIINLLFRSSAKFVPAHAGETTVPADCFEVRLFIQQEPEVESCGARQRFPERQRRRGHQLASGWTHQTQMTFVISINLQFIHRFTRTVGALCPETTATMRVPSGPAFTTSKSLTATTTSPQYQKFCKKTCSAIRRQTEAKLIQKSFRSAATRVIIANQAQAMKRAAHQINRAWIVQQIRTQTFMWILHLITTTTKPRVRTERTKMIFKTFPTSPRCCDAHW